MGLIVAILVGALVGWLASLVTKRDGEMGALANIIAGIVGAFAARLLFGEVLGIGSAYAAGTATLLGVLWGVVGAVIVIAIYNAVRRNV